MKAALIAAVNNYQHRLKFIAVGFEGFIYLREYECYCSLSKVKL